jgi:basic membrane lipoprotein Med (substrate-binding protein (PBP1-ABC) superfamily)
MVNPKAKVYLEWSSVQGTYIALARLRKRGINIISSMDFIRPGSDLRNSFGLYELNDQGKKNLAMPIWHWGIYYEKLIKSIFNRTMQREYENSSKAWNYYWGMSAEVVDVIYSKNLPDSVKKLAELLKNSVKDGVFNPFSGVIHTLDGRTFDNGKQGLSLEEIITMDWLLDNVEGLIPNYEQLTDEAKETVDSAGISV